MNEGDIAADEIRWRVRQGESEMHIEGQQIDAHTGKWLGSML